jgi:hypothetical protein
MLLTSNWARSQDDWHGSALKYRRGGICFSTARCARCLAIICSTPFPRIESSEISQKEQGDDRSCFPGFSIAQRAAERKGVGCQPRRRHRSKKSRIICPIHGHASWIACNGISSMPGAVPFEPANVVSTSSWDMGGHKTELVGSAGGSISRNARSAREWALRRRAIFS